MNDKTHRAYAVTKSGQFIEWRDLRIGQAKWRFHKLARTMSYNGEELKECGHEPQMMGVTQ